ncbi:Hint domain-containing protein [Ruegeria aquimaris]|uniref:Hint domain-containing protein n=1 Tax=Ruegeria aquimaris TaxID=2984333 RepID=A0ABT3APJ5_9RHOB|nr:Hint domain-containing protein [Ruegeria sp. XHP0148]MCV2890616.1 Hint domain-containing protein [Ruegeria sp. XHP0148]
MLLSHHTAFAEFTPVDLPLAGMTCGTLIETTQGWMPVERLRAGDRVAMGDGGFRAVLNLESREQDDAPLWRVPGGTFGACSDLTLTESQYLALNGRDCHRLFGVPMVLVPAGALAGFQGVHRIAPAHTRTYVPRFATEELVWAQTGLRVLCPGTDGEAHYKRLNYGQARALLLMMSGGALGADLAA